MNIKIRSVKSEKASEKRPTFIYYPNADLQFSHTGDNALIIL